MRRKTLFEIVLSATVISIFFYMMVTVFNNQPKLIVKNNFSVSLSDDIEIDSLSSNKYIYITSNTHLLDNSAIPVGAVISPDKTFQLNLPDLFEFSNDNISDKEIRHSISIRYKNSYGLIQEWNMPQSLDKFLSDSLKTSNMNFSDFKSSQYNNGYLWEYQANNYVSFEYFYQQKKIMIRISLFTPAESYSPDIKNTFLSIVNSLKVFN